MDVSHWSPAKIAECLDDTSKSVPEQEDEALRKAASKKVGTPDGRSMRYNSETRQGACISCSGCGIFKAKLKTCGACRTVAYCSKECQKAAWPAHKARCKEICENNAKHNVNTNLDDTKNVMQWLTAMPGMNQRLTQAAKSMEDAGDILSVVYVIIGENDNRCVLKYGGVDTMEKLEAVRQMHPEAQASFRLEARPDPPLYRIVIIVKRCDSMWIARARVGTPGE